MNYRVYSLPAIALVSSLVLASCGGGGGSGSATTPSASPPPTTQPNPGTGGGSSGNGGGSPGENGGDGNTTVQQTFTVDLIEIDASRVSNGSRIVIVTSGVTSGELTLTYEPRTSVSE